MATPWTYTRAAGATMVVGTFGWLCLSGSGDVKSAGRSVDCPAVASVTERSDTGTRRAVDALGRLPLRFEANRGQFEGGARFVARGIRYGMALTDSGAVLSMSSAPDRSASILMRLVGSDPNAPIEGSDPLPGLTHYYRGQDPNAWQTNVRAFERVRQTGVYDGIDLVYYGNQGRLEYDFTVAPGHDPAAIRLRVEGATRVEIDESGDLLLHVPGGEPVRQQKPISYQVIADTRHEVDSRYVRHANGDIGFEVGDYDRGEPLTIDPVIIYSTYFGGTSEETIFDIALDPAGNIYVTGRTEDQVGFPTTPGALQPTKPGASLTTDAFVSKFNPTGTALVYSTFLGGTGNDNTSVFAGDIAVDAAGNAYVTGDTRSSDFPHTPDAADGAFGGGLGNPPPPDAFYVKLGPAGALLYGTFIGGSDIDYATGIAVDAAGAVYVTGTTRSDAAEGFPQTGNAYSATLNGQDAFLRKFDANGVPLYSTYIGGSSGENTDLRSGGIAVDNQGRAYIIGDTQSTNFPLVNGRQITNGGGNADVFLAAIDTTLSGAASLVYSTYLGATGNDLANGIAFAGAGQVVIVGEADAGFPILNALTPNFVGGNSDAFITKIDTTQAGAASLVYSTFFGGADYDIAWDVAVDPQGAVHIVGETRSNATTFPLVNPVRTNFFGIEPFVAKFNPAVTAVVYSSYYGSESNAKFAGAVAANAVGDTFLAGATNDVRTFPPFATGLPMVNPFQSTYGGGDRDGFIARIGTAADLQLTKAAAPEPVAPGGTLTYTLTLSNLGPDPAASVTVTDTLPAGVAFVSCTATGGGVCGGAGANQSVTFPSLANGASATITIVTTVTAGLGASIVNTATVTSLTSDVNLTNNSAAVTSHTPAPDPSDTDSDTLPNDWETRFGLDPTSGTGANGANGDPDGDGLTNLQELSGGSHPRGFVITYLAEGATGSFFDTRLALANPTATPALVLTRFQRDDGTMVPLYTPIAPHSRATIDVEGLAGMVSATFSTLVEADVQVVADRTMTWGERGSGSHSERGILTRTATTWYLAEGATHGTFDLFYLLQNPGTAPAEVEISYLRPAPLAPVVRNYTVAPTSRLTIYVDQVPGLEATDVSGSLRSTNGVPVIAERAMYFSRPEEIFAGGHESAGVTAPANRWFLAEGATGSFFHMFILIANPSDQAATVEMRYLLVDGRVIVVTHDVAARSRFTINVAEEAPELASAAMSTIVTSTNSVPIVVERAMWWPSTGGPWYEAHNSPGETTTGTRWAMAEGESDGPFEKQTYILIANTSAFAGSARVTLLFEDGTTAERTFGLQPNSRTNVAVAVEFPAAAGRGYGALIESLGATPAQLVVERAMYSNAGGVIWAAGSNAVATKLQ